MNSEECPVCFTPSDLTINSNVCNHFVCKQCFDQLNKCPLCRREYTEKDSTDSETDDVATVVNVDTDDTSYADDLDDSSTIITGDSGQIPRFEGTDDQPTTNLFPGRLWYNVETEELNIFLNDEWVNESAYMLSDDHYEAEQDKGAVLFTCQNPGMDFDHNCVGCGIQRTAKANEYLIADFMLYHHEEDGCEYLDGKLYTQSYSWGTNAFDGFGLEFCINCFITRDKLCDQLRLH